MRRVLFVLTASAVVLGLGPAAALARHHHRAHRVHHVRTHARVRFERFGPGGASGGSAGTSHSNGHDQSSGTAEPGDQNGNAGMIASFDNGVLTIALSDGSTVSGSVTNRTELRCEAAESSSMRTDDEHDGQGRDHGDDNGDNGAEQGEDAHSCTTADLAPRTVVREAELRVSGGGASWDNVELVTSQGSSTDDDANES